MFGTKMRAAEYTELAVLFFLQSMASGIWLVPLSSVLDEHGFGSIRPYAFATNATAAFVSPLIFGAMADRHASPVVVLRGLCVAAAIAMGLVSWTIHQRLSPWLVLGFIQIYALCAVPTSSIASTIIFSRLQHSQSQFGPIRAAATVGWMCGCWLISALNADSSPVAGLIGGLTWLSLAGFTFLLPSVPPPPPQGPVTIRERMGWDALTLLKIADHRVVFVSAALFSVPLAAFYPYTPPHLQKLGFEHTAAWMSLGQVTEIVAMFSLGWLFLRLRLKWIFGAGLMFGLVRYLFCAMDTPGWLLAGLTLHGVTYTLFFVTGQIYLNERIDPAWRARAQALMWLVTGGVGNLIGYLGTGFWYQTTARSNPALWPAFWGGLAVLIFGVGLYFLLAYRGQNIGKVRRPMANEGR